MSECLPTVFVVDDDPSVRKSLARLLRSAGYQAESFGSATEFLDHVRAPRGTGCVVLDVQLPGLNGLEVQRQLQNSPDPMPIVFITGHGDIPMSVMAMKAGAVDFLSKPFQDECLLTAIHEAIDRGKRRQAQNAECDMLRESYERLTTREREVMVLVVRGLSNKQIAAELGIGEKTIKVHRGRVMKKMRVRSVADLVRASLKIKAGPE